MKLHEYQAKALVSNVGMPVERGVITFSPEEVPAAFEKLNLERGVLKAQIHAGGRGKAGGIQVVDGIEQAKKAAADLFGKTLVTPQTGPVGKVVHRVYVTETVLIARELYAGIVLDRSRQQLVFMVSTEGGVEIETVAAETPEKIVQIPIDRAAGMQPFQARQLAYQLGLTGALLKPAVKIFQSLYRAFIEYDCSLIEINPLVTTTDNRILALDLKMNVDDNALYRHPDIVDMRDEQEEDELEREAANVNLNYIKLDGNVGCMVNGAGLAMATMDLIKHAGAEPANFLDVGGGASAETVEKGFQIITRDKNVKVVLINIFGGIVRCDRVANGIVQAAKNLQLELPVVVRLAGTNADVAAQVLAKSRLKIHSVVNMEQAASKILELLKREGA